MVGVARVLILCLPILLAGSPLQAATMDVAIQGADFLPATVQISPGETVRWTNIDRERPHGVRSSAPAFDSGSFGQGSSFSFTYPTPGTFGYVCSVHPQMQGTVVVRGQAEPPQGPPVQVRAEPGTGLGRIVVSWQPPVDDGGSTILDYQVCRTGGLCSQATGTTFYDSGAAILETRRYTVAARNSFGTGPPSGEVCSKPFPWHSQLGC